MSFSTKRFFMESLALFDMKVRRGRKTMTISLNFKKGCYLCYYRSVSLKNHSEIHQVFKWFLFSIVTCVIWLIEMFNATWAKNKHQKCRESNSSACERRLRGKCQKGMPFVKYMSCTVNVEIPQHLWNSQVLSWKEKVYKKRKSQKLWCVFCGEM